MATAEQGPIWRRVARKRRRGLLLLFLLVIRYPAKVYFGTEIRYPTEFNVLPGMVSGSGRVIMEPAIIPTRFESRSTGSSLHAQ